MKLVGDVDSLFPFADSSFSACVCVPGVDCEESRNTEERLMLEDARGWLNAKSFQDVPHVKTGATALHVAAAKGYIKVMRLVQKFEFICD